MKKIDLNSVIIAKLTSVEVVELKNYLSTLSLIKVRDFILHVMDVEYTLSDQNSETRKVELFLADSDFSHIRDMIFNRWSDTKILQLERKMKNQTRQKKLQKIKELNFFKFFTNLK
jgi:hypothetical protein